jgi:hypothetical protein
MAMPPLNEMMGAGKYYPTINGHRINLCPLEMSSRDKAMLEGNRRLLEAEWEERYKGEKGKGKGKGKDGKGWTRNAETQTTTTFTATTERGVQTDPWTWAACLSPTVTD